MKSRFGIAVALVSLLATGACASAGAGGAEGSDGPSVAETKQSTTAKLFIAQAEGADEARKAQLYQQSLDEVLAGIAANPDNPQHYYLAGVSYAGLDNYVAADTMFSRAVTMFPEYAADVEIAREQAWVGAFNAAVNAYNAGTMDEAIRGWEAANLIYAKRPEGFFNLAALYTQNEDYDRAVQMYRSSITALDEEPLRELTPEEIADRDESRRTAMENLGQLLVSVERYAEAEEMLRGYLADNPDDFAARSRLAVALAKQDKRDEAMQTYQELLSSPAISGPDLFNIGVGLFQVEEFGRAEDAFLRVTEMSPNNRDAWYNLANALYAQEKWAEIIPAGERLLEMDPLNEDAALILARSYRETEKNRDALRVLEASEAAPVFVKSPQLNATDGRSTIAGTIEPKAAAAGTPVQLRFTFYGPSGSLGTETVTVQAPAAGSTTPFQVVLQNPTPAVAYSYQIVR